jgi:N-acetylglutamate synthase-like GNAT family acetyltransferase
MEKIAIRRAVVEDAREIVALLTELGYPNPLSLVKAKIKILIRSKTDLIYVAEIKGRIIAVVHLHIIELFHQPGRLGRVMALVVKSEHQRHGVGMRIMADLEVIAENHGCVRMEVTSRLHRDGAHSFYEKIGYHEKPKRFIKELQSIKKGV